MRSQQPIIDPKDITRILTSLLNFKTFSKFV